jgi:DNA-binding XRE family transcriptional regulator
VPGSAQTDPLERQLVLVLKEVRVKKRFSATQLAKEIGVSRSAITHLEADNTRPSLWILLRVCRGLGVELSTCLHQAKRQISEAERG